MELPTINDLTNNDWSLTLISSLHSTIEFLKGEIKVTTHLQTYFLKGLLYRKTNNGYLKEMISNFEF